MTTPHDPQSVRDTHALAVLAYRAAVAKLNESKPPWPADVWATYEQASADLHRWTIQLLAIAALAETVETVDGAIIVAQRHPNGTVLLTSDGGTMISAWHEGEPGDWSVRYERWSPRGLEGHGWIDRESRRLVQTG